jgi:ABC-type antimicrobial peptide transport system permease subunit
VIAGFLGLAAALIPAWRASRMDVLQAINTE